MPPKSSSDEHSPRQTQHPNQSPPSQTTAAHSTAETGKNSTEQEHTEPDDSSTADATIESCIEACEEYFASYDITIEEEWRNNIREEFRRPERSVTAAATTAAAAPVPVPVPEPTHPDPRETDALWTALKKRTAWPWDIILLDENNKEITLVSEEASKTVTIRNDNNNIYVTRRDIKIEARNMTDVENAIQFILYPNTVPVVKRPNVPALSWEKYATVQEIPYMPTAVNTSGEQPTKDMHGQQTKHYATAVYGNSGAGKTVYACFTLPASTGDFDRTKGDVVIHEKIDLGDNNNSDNNNDNDNSNAPINNDIGKLLKSIVTEDESVTQEAAERFKLAVAQKVLKHRHLAKDYEVNCNRIFEARKEKMVKRNLTAVDVVINILKEKFKRSDGSLWVAEERMKVEKFRTVILVLDEIGKCLPFARAVASSLDNICTHPWVMRRIERLRIVFCGTGSESLWSPTLVASDPRTIRAVHIKDTTPEYVATLHHHILQTKTQQLPTLRDTLKNDKVIAIIETNARMGAQFAKIVSSVISLGFPANVSATARLLERYDHAMTNAVKPLFIPATLMSYCNSNGLGALTSPEQMRVMDAALIYIQRKHMAYLYHATSQETTLVPLPKPLNYGRLLDDAARYGLLTRDTKVMSPAAGLLVMGAFGTPCDFVVGAELELFTHSWLQRLLEAQSGLPVRLMKFGTKQLPTRDTELDVTTLRSVLDTLQDKGCGSVSILNGEMAPGADVMGVQVRPAFDDVRHYMTDDGYNEVWKEGVVVRLIVLSDKMTNQGHKRQLETIGVMPSTIPTKPNNRRTMAATPCADGDASGKTGECFLAVRIQRDSLVYALSSYGKFKPGDDVMLCAGTNRDVGVVTDVLDDVEPKDLNKLQYPVVVTKAEEETLKQCYEINSVATLREDLNECATPIQYTILGVERAMDNRVTIHYNTATKQVNAKHFSEFIKKCREKVPDGVFRLEYKSPPSATPQLGPLVLALLGVRAWIAREKCARVTAAPCRHLQCLVEATMNLAKVLEWATATGAGAPLPLIALRRLAEATTAVSTALKDVETNLICFDAMLLLAKAHEICVRRKWDLLEASSASRVANNAHNPVPLGTKMMTADEATRFADSFDPMNDDKARPAMEYAQHVINTKWINDLIVVLRRSDVSRARAMLTDALKNDKLLKNIVTEDESVTQEAPEEAQRFTKSAKVAVSAGIVCGEDKQTIQTFEASEVLSGPEFDWVDDDSKGRYILFTPKHAHPLSQLMQAARAK